MKTQNNPLLTQIRDGSKFLRSIASLVIFAFSFVMYSPSVLAIVHSEAPPEKLSAKERYESGYQHQIDQLQEALEAFNRLIKNKPDTQSIDSVRWWSPLTAEVIGDPLIAARLKVIEAWEAFDKTKSQIVETNSKVSEALDSIDNKALRQKVEEKRQLIKAETLKKYQALAVKMDAISKADSMAALKKSAYSALRYIAQNSPEPAAHIYNSDDMPFGVSSDANRSPYRTAEDLHNYLGLDYVPDMDHAKDGINFLADYNSTPDVNRQHADIKALAESLGKNAKNIYQWVYNNIHYIPSFGSIQGSVQTLHNRQGNAFDIASLLIALLRASNIPARYVYGTVLLPADQVNNWVGGVDDIQSARVIMAQGGIPGSAVSFGGQYEKLRFEHVWVEAWGNFGQSGGYVWNPMDAAFKQYQYTDGIDFQSVVNFDVSQFNDAIQNAGTVNQADGWIANVDTTDMQAQLSQFQNDIQAYMANLPDDTTLAEVIGGQSIIEHTADEIPALPYEEYVRTRSFAELPQNLRHYFRVELANQSGGLAGGISGGSGTPLMRFDESLPQLAGKELALSFRAATADDEAILEALLGDVTDPADLPTELEAGLFNVIGEVTVDGEVVASSDPIAFGTVLETHKGFDDPRFGYRKTTSPITAGDYQAIGIDLQGVTVEQVQNMQTNLEVVQAQLQDQNIDGLTRHDVTGGIVQAVVLAYFAMNDAMTKLAAKMNGLVHYRMPSFGTFSTHSQVTSYWGAANKVSIGGMAMDIDWLMANNEGKVNCWQDWVAFNRMTGQMASAYEHVIPEQLLSTTDHQVEYVSTMKALQIANAEGQRIYTLTQKNIDTLLPYIDTSSQIKYDIQRAVAAGQVATIHEKPIQYVDYVGSGYVLQDLETGSGAYKISGGGNGSVAGGLFGVAISIMLLQLMDKPNALVLSALSAAALAAMIVNIIDRVMGNDTSDFNGCFVTGLIVGLRLGSKRLKNTLLKDAIGDALIVLGLSSYLKDNPKVDQCLSVRDGGWFGS